MVDQDIIRRHNIKGPKWIPTPDPRDADRPTADDTPDESRSRSLRVLTRAYERTTAAIRAYRKG